MLHCLLIFVLSFNLADAVWTNWVDGLCSTSCGPDGTMERTRICAQEGSNGGAMCADNQAIKVVPCNTHIYPCPGMFTI